MHKVKLCGSCENKMTCFKYKINGAMSNVAEKCEGYTECLGKCPYCGKETELNIRIGKAYIICSDHNCLGMMQVEWGTADDSEKFLKTLKDNWNKRA